MEVWDQAKEGSQGVGDGEGCEVVSVGECRREREGGSVGGSVVVRAASLAGLPGTAPPTAAQSCLADPPPGLADAGTAAAGPGPAAPAGAAEAGAVGLCALPGAVNSSARGSPELVHPPPQFLSPQYPFPSQHPHPHPHPLNLQGPPLAAAHRRRSQQAAGETGREHWAEKWALGFPQAREGPMPRGRSQGGPWEARGPPAAPQAQRSPEA